MTKEERALAAARTLRDFCGEWDCTVCPFLIEDSLGRGLSVSLVCTISCILENPKQKALRCYQHRRACKGLMDFTGHINPKITHFRRFYKMEKNYVEIQGRFSSDGRFVGGNYIPEVIDKLMNDVYSTLGQAGSLYRLRVTVEVEDLGAEVKFGKPASETQHSPALQRLTAGKPIPAPDVSPAAIDPAPEVVA